MQTKQIFRIKAYTLEKFRNLCTKFVFFIYDCFKKIILFKQKLLFNDSISQVLLYTYTFMSMSLSKKMLQRTTKIVTVTWANIA